MTGLNRTSIATGVSMSKQNPLRAGDFCRVNIGDSAYFGPGKRRWVDATVDSVQVSGNRRRYNLTIVADGSKVYSANSMDVKKR